MAPQSGLCGVCFGIRAPLPDLDEIIAATGNEPSDGAGGGFGAYETAGDAGGGPGDGVDADAVRGEDLVAPAVVGEFEDGDVAVGGGAGEEAAAFVRGPGEQVHRGGVPGEGEDARPAVVGFAPDEDPAVEGGGGQDAAIFRVGPGYAPDGAFVAREGLARVGWGCLWTVEGGTLGVFRSVGGSRLQSRRS